MSGHDATVRKLPTGWLRFYGACDDCDWRTPTLRGGRGEAEQAVDAHIAETGDCTCYDSASMEFGPNHPCAHCRAVGAA